MLISCVCVCVCVCGWVGRWVGVGGVRVCVRVCVGDIYLGHVQIKTFNIFHCVILNVAHHAFFRE